MKLEHLKKEIPYKWKVQSFNNDKTKGSCVAYIDARDVMDILDDVVGPENWQDEYKMVGDRLMCGIGILVNGQWTWKYDTGTESQSEAEKGQISDAFKRAAVKWGVGRFLYSLDIKWVRVENKKPVDETGKRIWNLTEHLQNQEGYNPNQQVSQYKIITINSLLEETGTNLDKAFEKWGINKIEDLTRTQADAVIKQLRIKKETKNV